MFLEQRVYQGSSGRVYPLPVIDRIADRPGPHAWDAVFVENEFIQVMILPALGGRIHRLLDKTNGYDAIYHQPVIKPALVGLAGPWASGGIEFNWPQHHRPSTYRPAEMAIERDADGAVTVWLGEHEPMNRLAGRHGVCLHPGRALVELKVSLRNRTADTQTFLWWANLAARVHERYQSFFPPDVTFVADHAKRAMSTFPLCRGHYYGVDYGARARRGIPEGERPRLYMPPHARPQPDPGPAYAPNDLSWYANIPVPTSYMAMGSREDFFGGYDHAAQAGIVHVADHRIAPGKKQWTWGNHDFGYAWDRNLTDADANGEFPPYIELMAGVFTDNQPDFSFLAPGETRAWSQYWYPIQRIGPAHRANPEVAVSLQVSAGEARIGVAVTARHRAAQIVLLRAGQPLDARVADLAPDEPFLATLKLPAGTRAAELTLQVAADGRDLIRYTPREHRAPTPAELAAQAATEPPEPADVRSGDELYLTGLHLEQYRHATRHPEPYWREALRRDPGDSRCHLALGRRHLRRGEWTDAERHLRAGLARLTHRNPNPADGETAYQLGRVLVFQADSSPETARAETLLAEAAEHFAKAAWNQAWQVPAHLALAELAGRRGDWPELLHRTGLVLRSDALHAGARQLRIAALRRLGRTAEAAGELRTVRQQNPLDAGGRYFAGLDLWNDNQVHLDLALDFARAGLLAEALDVLARADPACAHPNSLGTAPLLGYARAWLAARLGDDPAARRHRQAAGHAAPAHCFPARLEDLLLLEHAIRADPRDARAPFFLGHWLYDRRRHREALALWERAVELEPGNATAWRNLGLGAWNILRQPDRARTCYEAACRAAPDDARLLYERDQLWKRLGEKPLRRLHALETRPELVARRDDLAIELCALYNQTGQPARARTLLEARRFQPWEGGEGQALGQHVRTHLLLGRAALARGDANAARCEFALALDVPASLGEARHPLANASDIHFWLGEAHAALGDRSGARKQWRIAAAARGDFQAMRVQAFSELTYFSALALRRLGRRAPADRLLRRLLEHARGLASAPARIDYFATSLPTLLLFTDDLAVRRRTTALFLEAQARLGLGEKAAARRLLRQVLRHDPNHALAQDLSAEARTRALP